jgi:serine/threonine protein kinase
MHAGVVLVDRYRLADVLGTGGFGKVWRAHDEATGTDVAIKLMPRTALVHAWQKGLLEAESRALAALAHPRIVRCVATHLTDSHVLLVLELVQGRNLADELGERCQADRHYTLAELARHAEQLCEAVGFAHARGILHRDLKAANVMVAGDPAELKLLDFGIAKLLDGLASESTTTGRQLGTFTQLAPEVAMCAALDARVDIFGLGCLLFELASLRVPWVVGPDGHARRTLGGHILGLGGTQPAEIVHRICRAPRPSPLSYNPGLPAGVAEVLSRAMAVNPAHRYATASELLAAWKAALAGQVNVTLAPEVTPRRAPRTTDPDLDTILPTEAFGAGDQVMSSVEIEVSSAAPVIEGSRTQPDAPLDFLDTAEPVLGVSAVAEAMAAEPVALVESTSQRVADALELVEQFSDTTAVIARGARQAVTGRLVAPARPSGLAWSTSAPGLVSHGPVSMRVESPPPSRAQIHELHPRWVDFSSFVRSGFDVVPDMTGAPAVPPAEAPPQRVPWWALPSCALLVGPASYWAGPANGRGRRGSEPGEPGRCPPPEHPCGVGALPMTSRGYATRSAPTRSSAGSTRWRTTAAWSSEDVPWTPPSAASRSACSSRAASSGPATIVWGWSGTLGSPCSTSTGARTSRCSSSSPPCASPRCASSPSWAGAHAPTTLAQLERHLFAAADILPRQDGCVGVQGVHLRRPLPEALLRRVRGPARRDRQPPRRRRAAPSPRRRSGPTTRASTPARSSSRRRRAGRSCATRCTRTSATG